MNKDFRNLEILLSARKRQKSHVARLTLPTSKLLTLGASAYLEDWVGQHKSVEHAHPVCSSSASNMTTQHLRRSRPTPRSQAALGGEACFGGAVCVLRSLESFDSRHGHTVSISGSTACFHAQCAEAPLQRQVGRSVPLIGTTWLAALCSRKASLGART